MGKVNCDFCGTAFSEADEKCPICGYARNHRRNTADNDLFLDDELDFLNEEQNLRRKNKPIFNYDEVNADEEDDSEEEYEEDDSYDEEEEEIEESGTNTVAIIILVIIIALLLLATGFVFLRYFLPNLMDAEETTIATTEEVTTIYEDTTMPTVPCQMLALTSDAAKLNWEGQPWLLHVTVSPENTTDELIYVSENEAVATVSADGKIVAVGEGETIVKIICGEQVIKCPVIVDYNMVIDETAEDVVPTMEIEESTDPAEETDTTEGIRETQPVDAAETTDTPAESESGEMVLKLKESDISLSKVRGITYELTLDCDLTADQVEWITMNSNVLLVKNGVITVMGPGTTKVIAKYNGQSVECIVRCVF